MNKQWISQLASNLKGLKTPPPPPTYLLSSSQHHPTTTQPKVLPRHRLRCPVPLRWAFANAQLGDINNVAIASNKLVADPVGKGWNITYHIDLCMSRMNYWLNRWFGEKQASELGVFFAFLVITMLYGPTEILDIFSHHLKWPHLEREYSTKVAINFNIWLSLKRRKSPFISQTPLKHAQEHGTNVPEMRLLKLRSRIIYTIKSEVKRKTIPSIAMHHWF